MQRRSLKAFLIVEFSTAHTHGIVKMMQFSKRRFANIAVTRWIKKIGFCVFLFTQNLLGCSKDLCLTCLTNTCCSTCCLFLYSYSQFCSLSFCPTAFTLLVPIRAWKLSCCCDQGYTLLFWQISKLNMVFIEMFQQCYRAFYFIQWKYFFLLFIVKIITGKLKN